MNDRIKTLRKVLNLTQQEFADQIGMKRNTVANYETHRNEPSNAVITLICKTFNVDEIWLRTGEGEMFRKISRDEEISAFMGDVLRQEPTDIRKRLIEALSKLSCDDWKVIEKLAVELAWTNKKED